MTLETVEGLGFIRDQYRVKGKANILLVWRVLKACRGYSRLTVRQLYYIIISRFPKDYPATRAFYKRLDRYLTKIRRVNPEIHKKFIDPTRQFAIPPRPYRKIEVWVEKDSIKTFILGLLHKYRLGVQVLRGFASLSMYRKALQRAKKRGVGLVLYIGDHDPSGLLIQEVAREEMDHKRAIRFHRLAITVEQIKRFKPPSRPVNLKDSRAKEYIEKYGNRCWEVEAIRPRTLFRLIEAGLKEAVPPEHLAEAEARERAAKLARPVTERLRKMVEREVLRLLEEGVPEEEVLARISEKYGSSSQTQKLSRR